MHYQVHVMLEPWMYLCQRVAINKQHVWCHQFHQKMYVSILPYNIVNVKFLLSCDNILHLPETSVPATVCANRVACSHNTMVPLDCSMDSTRWPNVSETPAMLSWRSVGLLQVSWLCCDRLLYMRYSLSLMSRDSTVCVSLSTNEASAMVITSRE